MGLKLSGDAASRARTMANDEKAPARTITDQTAEIGDVREHSPKGCLQVVSTGDYVSVQTLAPIAHRGSAGRITKTERLWFSAGRD